MAALEAIHSIFGGFTDFGIGKGSIGRALRNSVKKNNQPGGPEKKNSKKLEGEKKEGKSEEIKKYNMQKLDEALDAFVNKNMNFSKETIKHKILKAFEEFPKIGNDKLATLIAKKENCSGLNNYVVKDFDNFLDICQGKIRVIGFCADQGDKMSNSEDNWFVNIWYYQEERRKGYQIRVWRGKVVVCDCEIDEDGDLYIGGYVEIY